MMSFQQWLIKFILKMAAKVRKKLIILYNFCEKRIKIHPGKSV